MHFIVENWMMIAIAVTSGLMLLWPVVSGRVTGIKGVGTLEATQLINRENAVVVDTRDDKEYAEGHIPGARNVPLKDLESRLTELEKFKSRPLIVNCRSGTRSSIACGRLRKLGFEQVYNLEGGILAWQAANLPVEKR